MLRIKTKEFASWLIGMVAGIYTAVVLFIFNVEWWIILLLSLGIFVLISLFTLWAMVKYVAYKLR
ncbi:MAG: sensor histidine kinase, partial [Alistipes sp.]|nr:sensor histidine kinase [Alistipes sp.]